jgi:[ribosomal protein S5]-alanine N-acetyltransferase
LVSIQLRPISLEDDRAITRLLRGDTELALRTAAIPIPYTIEHARAFLRAADPRQVFAIMAGTEFVGAIGFKSGSESIEIGYWIGRPYWGRGYATRAVRLLIEEAQRRGIKRLQAEVFPENFGSMRVLEKCGFLRECKVERDLPQRGGLRRLIRFQLTLSTEAAC